MSRWIDADALIEKEERYELDRYIDGERCYEMAVPSCAIIEAPSIDIVRCCECKYCHYEQENDVYHCYKLFHHFYDANRHFCSYGCRKTNAVIEEKPTPIRNYMVHGEREGE